MFALFLFALYRSLLESESHKYVPTWDSVVSLNNGSVIPYVPSIIRRTTTLYSSLQSLLPLSFILERLLSSLKLYVREFIFLLYLFLLYLFIFR